MPVDQNTDDTDQASLLEPQNQERILGMVVGKKSVVYPAHKLLTLYRVVNPQNESITIAIPGGEIDVGGEIIAQTVFGAPTLHVGNTYSFALTAPRFLPLADESDDVDDSTETEVFLLDNWQNSSILVSTPASIPVDVPAGTPAQHADGNYPFLLNAFVCTRASSVEGPSLFWQNRLVPMQPSSSLLPAGIDADTLRSILSTSASAWMGEDCSDFRFTVAPSTTDVAAGFDWFAGTDSEINQNLVVFRDGGALAAEQWLYPVGAIAITTATHIRSNGEILDADIELNAENYRFSTCEPSANGCVIGQDLQNTLTHELGHVLGLDHPTDHPEATMFPSANTGDIDKRDLAADDVAGLCTIYPAGAATGECYGAERVDPPALEITSTGCNTTGNTDALSSWILLGIGVGMRWVGRMTMWASSALQHRRRRGYAAAALLHLDNTSL